jgi:hypothetical protein
VAELRIGDQLIGFDREATVAAYSQIRHGDAERCGCAGCRNFIAARAQAFPDKFRAFLDDIGIDVNKEGEAVHYGPVEGDVHFYGGWFYFVGELIEAGERLTAIPMPGSQFSVQRFPGSGEGFTYWFGSSFPRPPVIFGGKVGAVEFTTLLPWIINDDPMVDSRPRANLGLIHTMQKL